MNKYKKKELLKIVSSLEKINHMVIHNVNSKITVDFNVLAECQASAIVVGNALESHGEVYESIVKILEDYCENLYQMSNVLEDKHLCRKIAKKVHKQLIQISNNIKHELPDDKIEIVFLPYKASMWDCLESVWKAASVDDRCDTYVVPIPYFDRNTDNSFGEMHYEGKQYPDYVPIIPWEEYDLSERKPDVIYFHNPYDQLNIVTSVPTQFYSSELQKHTDMLVYIPYFVAIEDNVAAHFCTVPGVLYANKVVVQSERVRQTYIEELLKYEKKHNCMGVFGKAEEKIVALGSPKYDKVLSSKREDFEIPKEWKYMIEKPDGSRKKVVLYNTTIDAMLNQPNMIQTIEQTISMFKDVDDIILLWRPHPLLKSTLVTMRRDLLGKYNEVEKKFKEAGWGIFDDSAELYRAITISDVYYGDWSSVAELYGKTNKPIIMQTAGNKENDTNISSFFFSGMTYYNDSLYGVSFDRNVILKANDKDGVFCYVGALNKLTNRLCEYCVIAAIKNRLFFVPFMEDKLIIYDLEKQQYEEVSLCLKEELKVENEGNFSNYCVYQNQLFLIPFGYRAILSYNLDTKEIKHVALLDEIFSGKTEKQLFTDYEYLDESHLLLPSFSSNKVVLFSLSDSKLTVQKLGEKGYQFCGIKKYKDDYFVVLKNKLLIIKWNFISGKIQNLSNFPLSCKESIKHCFEYKAMSCYKNYLYCFPTMSNMALKVNLDNGEIVPINSFDKYCKTEKLIEGSCIFDGALVKGTNIYLQYQKDLILRYDMITDEIFEYEREFSVDNTEFEIVKKDFLRNILKSTPREIKYVENEYSGEKIFTKILEYHKIKERNTI